MTCSSSHALVSFSRISSGADAMIASSWRRKLTWWPSIAVPRSKPSVAMAIFQPSPGCPTTLSRAVTAPSKKTSLNSDVPVSWRIGRTSTPGWFMGTSRYERPLCLSDPGSVRHSTKIQSE